MTHTCTNHVPGMYSCYARHACRCHDCREAARRVHKRAQHARRQGIPSRAATGALILTELERKARS